jgi:peptide/nickel transport system ATP-binding protein
LVGESGSGKTTIGRCLLRLLPATAGKVFVDDVEVLGLAEAAFQPYRRRMQVVFQDPYSSLNPRLAVGRAVAEPLVVHGLASKKEALLRAGEALDQVGMPLEALNRYPHEFSGGQRQRICIARAVALNPKFIICDEPLSALDVSIQAQIINLMKDLQEKFGYTYLFISHDLSVVEHISNTIGVMYLGNIMEIGDKTRIFKNPMHPYTKALLSAVPISDPDIKMQRIILKGDIPSPANPPSGCKFRTRCPSCMAVCENKVPILKEYEAGHQVACHLYPQD